jgi:hypothetical protein
MQYRHLEYAKCGAYNDIMSSHQCLDFLTTRRVNRDVVGMCPGSNVWKVWRSRLGNVHTVVAVAPKASTDLLR